MFKQYCLTRTNNIRNKLIHVNEIEVSILKLELQETIKIL